MYIDTHAHLNFNAFKDDYKDTIKRAFDAEIKGIINIGSNWETSEKAIKIAYEYKNDMIFAAIGLHPIHVKDEEFDLNKYSELAKDPKVVALGETGIDLFHDKNSIDLQIKVFQKILKIAKKVNKPVIIHSREADDEVLKILLQQKYKNLHGVLHCFGRNKETAKKFLNLGFLLSFTGNITYHLTPEREEMLKYAPLEKIMVETDCPYLAPEPYRSDRTLRQAQGPHAKGVRNEPAYVVEVAKKIAEIKNISLEEVEKTTTKNAKKLFKIK